MRADYKVLGYTFDIYDLLCIFQTNRDFLHECWNLRKVSDNITKLPTGFTESSSAGSHAFPCQR